MHTTPYGCELNFTVLVEDGATTKGAELVLYKKDESDTDSHLAYFVYIIYRKVGGQYTNTYSQRYIPSSCKSWQVFDISGIKDNLPAGVHTFNLLVAVFKETHISQEKPPIMSCSDVKKSLFVMDTSADIRKFKGIKEKPELATDETPVAEEELEIEVDENGKEKSDKNSNETAEDNQTEIEEVAASGSGEEEGNIVVTTTLTTTSMTTDTPPIEEVPDNLKVEDYLPMMGVFVSGGPNPLLTKRSAIEQSKSDIKEEDVVQDTVLDEQAVEENEVSSGANCRLLENKVDLTVLDSNVLQPTIQDIGKCSNSTDTVECRPTAFENLQVLVKKTGNIEVSSIEVRLNFIITQCTPFAKPQLSTDDVTSSSGSSPLRRRRFIDDTLKPKDFKEKDEKKIIEAAGGDTSDELDEVPSGEIGANCRLIENKIHLSTIKPDIVAPEVWDFGKCSGSTDVMECRPTEFRHLQVLLKTNEGISFSTLQNSIITKCTPYFNTPTVR